VKMVLDMVKGKARAAGSFLGGILNNPAVVILGGLAIVLLIFRGNISQAFADLGKGISGGLGDIKIELPEIKFPEFNFPEFKFPEIDFPDFPDFPDFQGLFTGFQEQLDAFKFPEIPPFFKEEGDETTAGGKAEGGIGLAGAFAERQRALRDKQKQDAAIAAIPDRDIQDDIEGLTPSQRFAFIERGVIPTGFQVSGGILEPISQLMRGDPLPDFFVKSLLLEEPTQQFEGGGISFSGGTIFETPIANLSLSQIIDKFNVTASQAANIKAIAGDDFGDFDFGTNTGSGIGSVFGTIAALPFQQINVSNQQFAGLSAEQIALQLTGGNISNF